MHMDLNSLSPYVRRTMLSKLTTHVRIEPRVIFDYELIHLVYGKFRLRVNGKDYICEKGDFILLRPGIPHAFYSIDNIPITQPHIHFDMTYDENSEKVYISFKNLDEFTEEERTWIRKDIFEGTDIGPILNISDKAGFANIMHETIYTFIKKPPFYQVTCKKKMLELLEIIFKDNAVLPEEDKSDNNLAALIRHYIDYAFKNDITLDLLEQQFSYSKFHISREFKQYTGKTVIRYYNEKRIAYAKKRLFQSASVSDVTRELSFSSIYSFSRWFKNAVGCAPNEFRTKK